MIKPFIIAICIFITLSLNAKESVRDDIGTKTYYEIFEPSRLNNPSSVLFVFNKDSYRNNKSLNFNNIAEREGILICYPDITDHSISSDVFNQIIKKLKVHYNIDSRRLFALGIEEGILSILNISDYSNHRFAAIALVNGSDYYLNSELSSPTPTLIIKKNINPIILNQWVSRNECELGPVVIKRKDLENEEIDHLIYNMGRNNSSVEYINYDLKTTNWKDWSSLEIWGFLSNFIKGGFNIPQEKEFYTDDINIYPNSSNSAININFKKKQNRAVKFISPNGDLLLNDKISAYHYKIPIVTYPNGVYFLEIDHAVYKVIKE